LIVIFSSVHRIRGSCLQLWLQRKTLNRAYTRNATVAHIDVSAFFMLNWRCFDFLQIAGSAMIQWSFMTCRIVWLTSHSALSMARLGTRYGPTVTRFSLILGTRLWQTRRYTVFYSLALSY